MLLLDVLLPFLLEILGQLLFEIAAAFGWESLKQALGREAGTNPILAACGHLMIGAICGLVSVLLVGRLIPRSEYPGFSLLLAPAANGVLMQQLGRLWEGRPTHRPVLFSLRAGAIVAFGMALARLACLELGMDSLWLGLR